MKIRPMTHSDLDRVLEIEKLLFPKDAWSEDLFLGELNEVPTTRAVSVVEKDGHVVGYASLRFIGLEGDINTIAVAPDFQRQGLGKLLLDWILETAKSQGVRELFLDVRADNEAAAAMYKSAGFERIDIRRNYYDHSVDAHVMRKKLS